MASVPVGAGGGRSVVSAVVTAPDDAAGWKAELDQRIEETRRAADAFGVSQGGPEGAFVGAILATIVAHSRIAEAADRRIQEFSAEERKRLEDLHRIGQVVLGQMRNGLIATEVQREVAVSRFMEKTAPVFAAELSKVLAIRERSWNFGLRMTWLAGAVVALAIAFAGGGGYVWWQHRDAVLALREFVLRSHVAGDRVWCPLSPAMVAAALPSGGQVAGR